MSLLMEALRKAEEAKRRSLEQEATAAPPEPAIEAPAPLARQSMLFSLEPRPPKADAADPVAAPPSDAEPTTTAADDISGYLAADTAPATIIAAPRDETADYLSGDPTSEDSALPPRASRKPRETRQTRDQLAAASVFAAKQTAARDPRKQARLATLFGLGVTLCLAAGGTLWWVQSQSSSGLGINPGVVNFDAGNRGFLDEQPVTSEALASASPADALPTTAEAPGTEPVPAAESSSALAERALSDPGEPDGAQLAINNITPEQGADLAAAAAASGAARAALSSPAPAAPPAPPALTVLPAPVTPANPAAAAAGAATAAAGALAQPAVPAFNMDTGTPAIRSNRTLEISRSSSRNVVNSTLQTAWNTLQSGDLQTAALLYREVLGELPNNRDAQIGLASIHLRRGEFTAARQLYAQLLTLDPQDPYARTGFLQATQSGNDPGYENELKSLLQRHPALPPLHFALGNFHAGQQRWHEAQSAYFDALLYANRDSTTPVSPDYAFNLAVSLEQLQQPQAALNYYRQAQELSRSSPPGFDPALLQRRLALLEQTQP